jgi:hypothetical protein
MEDRRRSEEDTATPRRISSPPLPCFRKESPTNQDVLNLATPRDYEKLNKKRYEIIAKNINHIITEIEDVREELTNLKIELHDTSKDAKNSIYRYQKRNRKKPTDEKDPVDVRVAGMIKRVNKANDNLDLITLHQ